MNRSRWRSVATLVVLVVLVAVARFGTSSRPSANDAGSRPVPAGQARVDPGPARTSPAPESLLARLVTDPAERNEVETTLAHIASNGPYAHGKDGSVFSNREGRLPRQPRGHYREYTVQTPGASNRGARRIVRGDGGETYYTRDHYGTFIRIDEGRTQ